MRSIIIGCSFLLFSHTLFAQANKADSSFIWQKSIGTANESYAYSIEQTLDRGYIVTGTTNSSGAGGFDVFLLKLDSNVNTIWSKTYGGVGSDAAWVTRQTTDGGYIIAGGTFSFGAGSSDIYVIRTNQNGDTMWTKTMGGLEYDDANAVQETSEQGFIIVGSTKSFGSGAEDVYMIKLDSLGDLLWTKTYGFMLPDAGNDVQLTTDSGYIIVGMADYNFEFSTTGHIYLIKTDADGDTIWTKKYGGGFMDLGFSVKQVSDGGFIIAGYTKNFSAGGEDVILLKTDIDGNLLWSNTYGGIGNDYGYSVLETDSGYIIGGSTGSFGNGGDDIYLIKTNFTGDILWSMTYGSAGNEMVFSESSMTPSSNGGYTFAGYHDLSGFTYHNILILKADINGNGGCNQSSANSLINNASLSLINTPTVIGSGGIVGNTATIVGTMNLSDSVLCYVVGLKENALSMLDNVAAYPNPFTETLTISIEGENKISSFSFLLYDQLGRIVKEKIIIQKDRITINREGLSNGIYVYKIMSESGHMYTGKLVIQ